MCLSEVSTEREREGGEGKAEMKCRKRERERERKRERERRRGKWRRERERERGKEGNFHRAKSVSTGKPSPLERYIHQHCQEFCWWKNKKEPQDTCQFPAYDRNRERKFAEDSMLLLFLPFNVLFFFHPYDFAFSLVSNFKLIFS